MHIRAGKREIEIPPTFFFVLILSECHVTVNYSLIYFVTGGTKRNKKKRNRETERERESLFT